MSRSEKYDPDAIPYRVITKHGTVFWSSRGGRDGMKECLEWLHKKGIKDGYKIAPAYGRA